ncbi:hypothetical protein D3C87_2145240 [compost metagenome]
MDGVGREVHHLGRPQAGIGDHEQDAPGFIVQLAEDAGLQQRVLHIGRVEGGALAGAAAGDAQLGEDRIEP